MHSQYDKKQYWSKSGLGYASNTQGNIKTNLQATKVAGVRVGSKWLIRNRRWKRRQPVINRIGKWRLSRETQNSKIDLK